MSTPARLASFAAVLATLLGLSYAVGAASGVEVEQPPTHEASDAHGSSGESSAAHEEATGDDAGGHDETDHGDAVPAGVLTSSGGYTLADLEAPAGATEPGTLSFHILGPDGHALTTFETQHSKQLHLIVVSQDLTDFFHVHPQLADDGTWSIEWSWPRASSYRVYADFVPGGATEGLTLAQDLTVAGDVTVQPLPAESRVAEVDGYAVTLDGDLSTEGGALTLGITHDGEPVTDLDPYLGAYGHLVAIRVGDLAYLHVHPEGEVGTVAPGPQIEFSVTAPTPGTYRLFLDFSHEGVVRTVSFTVVVAAHEH